MENNINSKYQRCSRGLWDTSIPGITFDENGVSNYARMFDAICEYYPRGEKGKEILNDIINRVKEKSKKKKYDCIIGISGGTDSSYLLHLAKNEYNLRPLAVNLDNGWNSEISLQNIKKITSVLDVDLETYVVNYEEIKNVFKAYLRAGLPWIDGPTDIAINSLLYMTAFKEKVPYILIGSNIRTEGKQPIEWTYTDYYQLNYLLKKFSPIKLKSFPLLSFNKRGIMEYIFKIRIIKPLNYLDYDKNFATELLREKYKWEYYGEHHHENIFTKFVISYWLYEKFKIDKRIITYSAQLLSNYISREKALKILEKKPYNPDTIEREIEFVLKKLEIKKCEFDEIWKSPNKYYYDYPNKYQYLINATKIIDSLKLFKLMYNPNYIIEHKFRNKYDLH